MLNGLVYDAETVRPVPPQQGDRKPGLEYCDGWDDYKGAGVSVVAAYSWSADCYFLYEREQLPEFQALVAVHDEVFGFHSLEFDDQLLAAAGCQVQTTYDVLCEIRAAAGFPRDWTKPVQPGEPSRKGVSFSLELLAQLNLGYGKIGYGNPPELWQQGHKAQVKARCLHDVKLLQKLLELSGVVSGTEGRLLDSNTARWLYLKPLGAPSDAYRSLDLH